jgi:hypothetical protein
VLSSGPDEGIATPSAEMGDLFEMRRHRQPPTNEPAKIPHCARSSSDSRSTAKPDKVCDRDTHLQAKFNLEVELKNIILVAFRFFEFLHSQGQNRKRPHLNGKSVLPRPKADKTKETAP